MAVAVVPPVLAPVMPDGIDVACVTPDEATELAADATEGVTETPVLAPVIPEAIEVAGAEVALPISDVSEAPTMLETPTILLPVGAADWAVKLDTTEDKIDSIGPWEKPMDEDSPRMLERPTVIPEVAIGALVTCELTAEVAALATDDPTVGLKILEGSPEVLPTGADAAEETTWLVAATDD